jgi:DNA-binding FadR family transcriptional regulator
VTTTYSLDHQRIFSDLLEAIRAGEIPAGGRLPSRRLLADLYGVDPRLADRSIDELVRSEVVVRKGSDHASVIVVPPESRRRYGLLDLVEAREVVETGALRLAALRVRPDCAPRVKAALSALDVATVTGRNTAERDLDLHRIVVDIAGSEQLSRLWSGLTAEIARAAPNGPHGRPVDRASLDQHRRYAEGVIQGRPAQALDACESLNADHRWLVRGIDR